MIDNSFHRFEDIYSELKDKPIGEWTTQDICKFLLVEEELNWMDENIGDDKIFYTYDENLLSSLSYKFSDSIFRLINEELLYDNDLHTAPEIDDLEY